MITEIRKNKQLIVHKGKGDCFRACITSLLGISNNTSLPNCHEKGWFLQWDRIFRELGLELHFEHLAFWRNGYWIASVKK